MNTFSIIAGSLIIYLQYKMISKNGYEEDYIKRVDKFKVRFYFEKMFSKNINEMYIQRMSMLLPMPLSDGKELYDLYLSGEVDINGIRKCKNDPIGYEMYPSNEMKIVVYLFKKSKETIINNYCKIADEVKILYKNL